jgi:hypothetical protein
MQFNVVRKISFQLYFLNSIPHKSSLFSFQKLPQKESINSNLFDWQYNPPKCWNNSTPLRELAKKKLYINFHKIKYINNNFLSEVDFISSTSIVQDTHWKKNSILFAFPSCYIFLFLLCLCIIYLFANVVYSWKLRSKLFAFWILNWRFLKKKKSIFSSSCSVPKSSLLSVLISPPDSYVNFLKDISHSYNVWNIEIDIHITFTFSSNISIIVVYLLPFFWSLSKYLENLKLLAGK